MIDQTLHDLSRQASELLRQGRNREALHCYKRLVELNPRYADAWFNLGYLLKQFGNFEGALDAYAEALRRGVGNPEQVHLNRAVIFSDHLRRESDAERELQAALALAPDFHAARLNLGLMREEQGDRQAAIMAYEGILSNAAAPLDLQGEALSRLAHLTPPASLQDPLLRRMEDAIAVTQGEAQANLLYALGRVCDKLGAYEKAFAAFRDANLRSRPSNVRYEPEKFEGVVDRIIEFFNDPAPAGQTSVPSPLFICGMFRSGSTLAEQILAAHGLVTAGGELDLLPRMVRGKLTPFPMSMASVDHEELARLAQAYLHQLRSLFPDTSSRYITDKRPDNFLLIGLILKLFPSARIVHTRRDPLDNGLSIFMQHLDPRTAPYSFNLADIGHFFGQYQRLMSHWREMYPEAIFDLDYDRLVQDPEPQLRRLLGFLELPWDDRCLQFHEQKNTVKTASYWQVREPLSTAASGRWRRYNQFLDPLRDGLSRGRPG